MYSEKLEMLIKVAIADGYISKKERNVLLNCAKEEGIDIDEFEMILEGRLLENRQSQGYQSAQTAQAKQSKKLGEVHTCPSCGAVVPSVAGRCSECGFEFSGLTENITYKKLAETLEKISLKWEKEIANTSFNFQKRWRMRHSREQELAQAITTTLIPVSKSDLFEFIIVAQTAAMSPSTSYVMADAYMAKCEEAILKARTLFPDDEVLATICTEYEKKKLLYPSIHAKQSKVSKLSPLVIFIICYFGSSAIMGIIALIIELTY